MAAVLICERRRVPMHLVCTSAKTPDIVAARDEIVRTVRSWGWSYPQIGALLNKNHSTIVIGLHRQVAAGRAPRSLLGRPCQPSEHEKEKPSETRSVGTPGTDRGPREGGAAAVGESG